MGSLMALSVTCLSGDWVTHEDCVLKPNSSNDGDSFHVMVGEKEHIFRLYFVDAPETGRRFPERISQQAQYWDIRESQVLASAREATRFTRNLLAKPFTVHTRGEDARGQSVLPREFAFIETSQGKLSELLVTAGFARSYGLQRSLPDGTPAKTYARHLDALEKEARKKRLGAWRTQPTRLSQIRESVEDVATGSVTLAHTITLYTTNQPPAYAGSVPKGTTVRTLGAASSMLVRIAFEREGAEVIGLCRRTELNRAGVATP